MQHLYWGKNTYLTLFITSQKRTSQTAPCCLTLCHSPDLSCITYSFRNIWNSTLHTTQAICSHSSVFDNVLCFLWILLFVRESFSNDNEKRKSSISYNRFRDRSEVCMSTVCWPLKKMLWSQCPRPCKSPVLSKCIDRNLKHASAFYQDVESADVTAELQLSQVKTKSVCLLPWRNWFNFLFKKWWCASECLEMPTVCSLPHVTVYTSQLASNIHLVPPDWHQNVP